MRLDQLDDPRPPTFGRAQLEKVVGRADLYRRRRRQRGMAVGSAISGVAVVAVSTIALAGGHVSRPSDSIASAPAAGQQPSSGASSSLPWGSDPLETVPQPLSPTAEATEGQTFTSDGGSIACIFQAHAVTCRQNSSMADLQGQEAHCEPQEAMLTLPAGAKARVVCDPTRASRTQLPVVNTFNPVRLSYGSILCTSAPKVVVCEDTVSHWMIALHDMSYTYGPLGTLKANVTPPS